jgi:hypothetical protein
MLIDRRYWKPLPKPASGIGRIVIDAINTRKNRSAVGLFVVDGYYRLIRAGEPSRNNPALMRCHVGDFGAGVSRDAILDALAKHNAAQRVAHSPRPARAAAL